MTGKPCIVSKRVGGHAFALPTRFCHCCPPPSDAKTRRALLQGCPGKIFAWRGLFLTSPRARGEHRPPSAAVLGEGRRSEASAMVRARNARAPGEGAPDKATRHL